MCALMENNQSDHTPSDRLELIQLLMLEAGRIMEDISPLLALRLPQDADELTHHVDELHKVSDEIAAFARTAELLSRASGKQA